MIEKDGEITALFTVKTDVNLKVLGDEVIFFCDKFPCFLKTEAKKRRNVSMGGTNEALMELEDKDMRIVIQVSNDCGSCLRLERWLIGQNIRHSKLVYQRDARGFFRLQEKENG